MSDTSAGISTREGYKFGTFKGVFTPSILTILGVVMYLRFGYVLGNMGLGWTLVIVTLASSITFMTGLSLSALATNMKVGGGGAYYIISRSLGIEAGAAVGLPLFFAQALGISFYIAGFSEALVNTFHVVALTLPYYGAIEITLTAPGVGIVTLCILTALAYYSADLALKTQFIVMGLIFVSLISFFLGTRPDAPPPDPESFIRQKDFFLMFAIFFPAVTGIEAGIAMSGDLKDPAKSLPRGTIAAVLTGYVVYMAIPIYLHYLLNHPSRLITNPMIMRDVARYGSLIVLGVWAASLSSAMGALLGAPRTLQALAVDRIVPRILGHGFGRGNDPRVATAVSFLVAFVGVMLGDLNLIAPILSMFFLTSYGLLNVSAGLEELLSPPSWRPKFRVPWALSLIGAFACFATMFMINPGATFLAGFVSGTVYYLMKRRSLRASWGDMRSGLSMLLVRHAVHALSERQLDEHTWRPNILVLSGTPTSRWYLIELANAISQGRGLLTVGTVVPEDTSTDRLLSLASSIKNYLDKRGVSGLSKVYPAADAMEGMHDLVKTYGFGPITPNTILLGETQKPEHFVRYAKLIQHIHRRRQNLVIVRESEDVPQFLEGMRIDVWLTENPKNRGLMLALAYLLGRSHGWRSSSLVLKTVVDSEEKVALSRKHLLAFIEQSRLDAEAEVIVKPSGADIFTTIRNSSVGSDLVFLGIRAPAADEAAEAYSEYYRQLLANTIQLPPTALILANEDIDFSAIFEQE